METAGGDIHEPPSRIFGITVQGNLHGEHGVVQMKVNALPMRFTAPQLDTQLAILKVAVARGEMVFQREESIQETATSMHSQNGNQHAS